MARRFARHFFTVGPLRAKNSDCEARLLGTEDILAGRGRPALRHP